MPMFTLIDNKGATQGDFIRIIFTHLDLTFNDKQVTFEEAKNMKSDLPTGGLPVLDSAGTYIGETGAIARYLARLYNLYGANAMEQARIDMTLEQMQRLTNFFHASFLPEQAKKESDLAPALQPLREHGLSKAPDVLFHLEQELKKNGGHHFAGSKTSIADLAAFFYLRFLQKHDKDFAKIFAKYPALNKHVEKVAASNKNFDSFK